MSGESFNGDSGLPLKERVVDRYFDPLSKLFRIFSNPKA